MWCRVVLFLSQCDQKNDEKENSADGVSCPWGVDFGVRNGDISHMRTDAAIRIGARSRCYLAGFAREGEVYRVDMPNPDEIRLRRMTVKEPKKHAFKIVMENGRPVVRGGPIVTPEMVAKVLEDFP